MKDVYVIDWGKQYSDLYRWVNGVRENIFPIKTELPNYCETEFYWKCTYEPNLTLKGTVNKREPTKLVSREPVYKDFKWKIVEKFKHPSKDKTLLLLTSIEPTGCYIVMGEKGVSDLPRQEYLEKQNLGKWNRNAINKHTMKDIPKEIISVFYDKDDNVLFGNRMTKGLVSYFYLDKQYSTDNKPIFLYSSITYDGKGNKACPDRDLIKEYKEINNYLTS